MESVKQKHLRKERLKWGIVILLSAFLVLFFSPEKEVKDLAHQFFNPILILKVEQENPINRIVTKIFPQNIPDRLKELL